LQTMTIEWRQADGRSEYVYGDIAGSKVSAQVGRSTKPGHFMWVMFHEDIRCAIYGGEAGNRWI